MDTRSLRTFRTSRTIIHHQLMGQRVTRKPSESFIVRTYVQKTTEKKRSCMLTWSRVPGRTGRLLGWTREWKPGSWSDQSAFRIHAGRNVAKLSARSTGVRNKFKASSGLDRSFVMYGIESGFWDGRGVDQGFCRDTGWELCHGPGLDWVSGMVRNRIRVLSWNGIG